MSRILSASALLLLGSVDAASNIYGTSVTGGLVKIDGSTGKLTPEGPDHPEELEGKMNG